MDFQKEVIDKSKNQPIVVDFWAPWCGPCQFLGPVLEELESAQSKWKLVKVNVDENPEISHEYGIRGIPDVRLFSDGQVVGQFTGALPKHQIEKWLKEHIPDERLEEMYQLITEGKRDKLESFVKDNPDLDLGKVALASMILWENSTYANELVSGITPDNDQFAKAESIRTIHEFMSREFEDEPNVSFHLKKAYVFREKRFDDALENIIQAVMIDKHYENDLPRRLAIALFNYLGNDHEITKKHRRKFDMALY